MFGFYAKFAVRILGSVIVGIAALSISRIVTDLLGPRLVQYTTAFCLLLVVDQFNTLTQNPLLDLGLERLSEPMSVLCRHIFGITAITLVVMEVGVTGALIGEIAEFGLTGLFMFGYVARKLDWKTALRRTADIVPKEHFYNIIR